MKRYPCKALVLGIAVSTLIIAWSVPTISLASVKVNEAVQVSVSTMPQSKLRAVQGRVLVNAPPHSVWRVLTDYADWQYRIPGYERTNLKSLYPYKTLDVSMRVSPFLPPCRYQVQVNERPDSYQLTFQRISGDFNALKAVYQLIPQNNGSQTLLKYTLYIDIGKPLPGIAGVLKASTEKSLAALKRHSELEASRSAIGQR